MSANDDPRCPECGEPIGATATYCMHCSADLTREREHADGDEDGRWGGSPDDGAARSPNPEAFPGRESDAPGRTERLLDPEGLLDNSMTVVVGIVGGLLIGIIATVSLLFLTGGVLAFLGLVAWLAATAYLVRQHTVQGAISKAAYGVALVLLLVPLIPLSPAIDMDLGGRGVGFVVLLFAVGTPAGIAALIGYVASRYVPDSEGAGERTDRARARQ